MWNQAQDPTIQWPGECTIRQGKLYYQENCCVPEDLVLEVVRNHHFLEGHISSAKLAKALPTKYVLGETEPPTSLLTLCDKVKKGCIVCQACDHPTWLHR